MLNDFLASRVRVCRSLRFAADCLPSFLQAVNSLPCSCRYREGHVFVFGKKQGFTGLSLYFTFICAVTSLALYAFMNRSRVFSPAERYRDSTLTDRELESFHRALLAFMDSDQPFLDPDLSLPRLAEKSRIPQKTLSRVINERVGVNFNDFVNEYRIRESCRLLSSRPSGTPVLDILYESGFNSKSTFNDAFKKKTGKTPSEFRAGAAS